MAVASRDTSLDLLAEEIRREHALAEQSVRSAVEHAIKAGEALLEAKTKVEHGQWEPWLADVFTSQDLTMPRVYMRLARFADEVRAGNPPTIRAAQRMLSGGAHATVEPRLVSEAQRLRKAGKTYQEISEQLGMAKTTVARYVDPKAARKHQARARRQTVQARRALAMEERSQAARKLGGDVGKGYALLRRTLQALDSASVSDTQARRYLDEAMHRLYDAEELIGRAIRSEGVE